MSCITLRGLNIDVLSGRDPLWYISRVLDVRDFTTSDQYSMRWIHFERLSIF
jgi:hypothetical protein